MFRYGDRFWDQVWHVDTGTATDVPAGLLVAFETFAHVLLADQYSLARIIRRPLGSHDEFIELLVDAAGGRVTGTNKLLPLFNVVRVLLQGGIGRPGLKYTRGFLIDADLADEQNHIVPSTVTAIQNAYNDLFNAASDAACSFIFGADNKVAITGVVDNLVAMRQQHRKRKKSV